MCILCGCDYCDTIRGIGQVKAYQFIQKYRTIEEVLKHLPEKFSVPKDWPYQRARELFKNPEVVKGEDVKISFSEVNREGLKEFLVNDKGFNPERVDGYIEKLQKAKDKCKQKRMDSFFTVKSSSVKRAGSGAAKDSKKKKWLVCCKKHSKQHCVPPSSSLPSAWWSSSPPLACSSPSPPSQTPAPAPTPPSPFQTPLRTPSLPFYFPSSLLLSLA